MKSPMLAGALAAVLLTGAAPLAQAQTDGDAAAGSMFRATTLNVSAHGDIKTAPDMATISLGVETQAPTAAQAMAANADRMSQVVAALKRGGIPARDIQTSGLNLGAQYDYQPNLPPKLNGYTASNQVTVTVNDLARLGPSLDAVVAAGANQVNGVSFGLKDPQAAEDAARVRAVQALQARASLYANAAGLRVVRLINLSEGGGYAPPQPVRFMAKAMVADAAPTPVEPGQLNVRIDVSGMYELAK